MRMYGVRCHLLDLERFVIFSFGNISTLRHILGKLNVLCGAINTMGTANSEHNIGS